MENSQLIHEFTDGTLEPTSEPMLFNILANDEELRHEFKQELAIKSAIRSDNKAFTPAAASTLGIFSSLGFAPPATVVGSAVVGGVVANVAKSAGFLTKLSASLLSGIVATIATAIVSYFVFQPQIDDLMNNNKNLSSQMSELKNKPEIPLVQGQKKDVLKENSNKPVVKYIVITKEVPAKQESIVEEEPDLVVKENEEVKKDEQNKPLQFEESKIINSYSPIGFSFHTPAFGTVFPVSMDISDLLQVKNDLGISFELNKMENWFEYTPTINPKQFNKFNNSSVSLMYNFLGEFNTGLQYRQETFFQSFISDSAGKKFNYQQQPNFSSLGFLIRYSNKDYNFFGIYPYLQAYVGGTSVGPIGRMLLGIRYSPYKGIVFHVGGEYSKLWYKHQGNDFHSGKYDLNYGLSFEF